MVTVNEIWKEVFPPGTQLLTRAEYLDHEVSWVQVLKPRPPGLDAPRGDEFILISTQTLASLDPHLTLARVLQSVTGRASGVAVRGDVPDEAVAEAERQRLPLFQLPAS